MKTEKLFSLIADYFSDKPVVRVSIFGSYARGEQKKSSDIDVLIKINPKSRISIFALSGYKIDLEKLIGKKVDLGTEDSLSKFVKPIVDKERKIFYEA